jgi:hypothetical protein
MGGTILIAEELSAYMVISAYCEYHSVEPGHVCLTPRMRKGRER